MTREAIALDDPRYRSTVFVYGSLKRGHRNHILLGDPNSAEPLGQVHINGRYRLLDLGSYPGIIKHSSFPVVDVVGEAYRVTQDVLRALDLLEGNTVYYTRKKVECSTGMRAWCYFLPYDQRTPAYGQRLDESLVQCWRPTAEDNAYMLTLGAAPVVRAPSSAVAHSAR